jgi:hypothetical protein
LPSSRQRVHRHDFRGKRTWGFRGGLLVQFRVDDFLGFGFVGFVGVRIRGAVVVELHRVIVAIA